MVNFVQKPEIFRKFLEFLEVADDHKATKKK